MKIARHCGTSQLQLPDDSYIYQILPINSRIAAISSDDSIRLADPVNLALHNAPDGVLPNANTGITCLASIHPSSSSATLVSAGRDATLRAWDVRGMMEVASFKDEGQFRSPHL